MIGYRFFCGEIVSRLYDTHRPIVLTRRLIKFDRVLVRLRIDFVTLRRTCYAQTDESTSCAGQVIVYILY